jgi:hypothetical protein
MQYILIKSDNVDTFIRNVYSKLCSGWKPHGDIFTFQKDGKTISSLAVIKEQDKLNPDSFKDKTVEEILASWNC